VLSEKVDANKNMPVSLFFARTTNAFSNDNNSNNRRPMVGKGRGRGGRNSKGGEGARSGVVETPWFVAQSVRFASCLVLISVFLFFFLSCFAVAQNQNTSTGADSSVTVNTARTLDEAE